MRATKTTNPELVHLIRALAQKSKQENIPLWGRVAEDLAKPTRSRRVVNLSRINRFTKANEMVVVPGKVLSTGEINHKVTVAAFSFSDSAKEKITKADGKAVSLQDMMKESIKGKKIKLLG